MALHFLKIVLPVRDIAKTMHFLTFIFDCEVIVKPDHVETILGGQRLLLQLNHEAQGMPINWVLAVESLEDLENLAQKIELYCYREGLPSLIQSLNAHQLIFWDLESNLWTVEFSQQELSSIQTTNVRNF
jgi:hypothetical protein